MNYEWEIQKLELQLKHMREMNAIYTRRGSSMRGNRLDRVESSLERLEEALAAQTKNVDRLLAAMLRDHSNGDSKT